MVMNRDGERGKGEGSEEGRGGDGGERQARAKFISRVHVEVFRLDFSPQL